ncbi:MAG: type II toxin-antitoxin system RelE/ParE family toxin [Deltaproteobacteria bacterium]|nr:type II toxin-antitoxin system RelE/ParE family toxin [Deltaproteobacteria bacterium]
MSWGVEFTDEFGSWWTDLDEDEQDSIDQVVGILEARGPSLPFPYCSDVKGSKHGNMRELRVQHRGEPYRIFYAFDPRRSAILLIGGNKTGDDLFYERMVPQADRIYDDHLRELDQATAGTPTKAR